MEDQVTFVSSGKRPQLLDNVRERMLLAERMRFKEHDYAAFHSHRYDALLQLIGEITTKGREVRILDVGRSPLSYRLAARYREVVTLGFPLEQLRRDFPNLSNDALAARPIDHIVFNLNDFGYGKTIDTSYGSFDLIVFAETMEHLFTAPELVLAGLAEVLRPGGFLVCQTPNAAALHKRLKLLVGYNPFERIRADATNPGHFREYTRAELIEIGRTVGLEVVCHVYRNYFGCEGSALRRTAAMLVHLVSWIVPSFARGQTIVYRRPVA